MYIKGIYPVKVEVPNVITQIVLGDAALDIKRFRCVRKMPEVCVCVCVCERERERDEWIS